MGGWVERYRRFGPRVASFNLLGEEESARVRVGAAAAAIQARRRNAARIVGATAHCDACAAAFAASFACRAAASLLSVNEQNNSEGARARALFASLQRREVGAVLALALLRCLQAGN